MTPPYKKKKPFSEEKGFGDPERTRFAAAKPRPGKQSTGLFAWTGLSNPSTTRKSPTPKGVGLFLAGAQGLELL